MIFPELSMAIKEEGGGSGPAASQCSEAVGDDVCVTVHSKKERRMGHSAKQQEVIIHTLIDVIITLQLRF